MPAICVFCSSSSRIPAHHVDLATQVGAVLAARGHSLVSGGGAVSMMGAVAHAARAGGARTVGVIPQALLELEVGDQGCDELVVVGDMRTRKREMEERADAFLALPGGIGTLEELLEVWTSRSLGMHTKPVVVLDPNGLYAPLRAQLALLVEQGFVRDEGVAALTWTTSVAAALDALEAGIAAPERLTPTPEDVLEVIADEPPGEP